jgi:hypothetical protein
MKKSMLKEMTNGLGLGRRHQLTGSLIVRCVLAGAGCAIYLPAEFGISTRILCAGEPCASLDRKRPDSIVVYDESCASILTQVLSRA